MSVRKTFRFSESMQLEFEELLKAYDTDQTGVIRRVIHDAAQRLNASSDNEHTTVQTGMNTQDKDLIDAMKAHITDLETQLAATQENLRLSLETTRRQADIVSEAHILNAADKVESLPGNSDGKPMSRWDHFKAAFRKGAK